MARQMLVTPKLLSRAASWTQITRDGVARSPFDQWTSATPSARESGPHLSKSSLEYLEPSDARVVAPGF